MSSKVPQTSFKMPKTQIGLECLRALTILRQKIQSLEAIHKRLSHAFDDEEADLYLFKDLTYLVETERAKLA